MSADLAVYDPDKALYVPSRRSFCFLGLGAAFAAAFGIKPTTRPIEFAPDAFLFAAESEASTVISFPIPRELIRAGNLLRVNGEFFRVNFNSGEPRLIRLGV